MQGWTWLDAPVLGRKACSKGAFFLELGFSAMAGCAVLSSLKKVGATQKTSPA
jgi:hypothetical protein